MIKLCLGDICSLHKLQDIFEIEINIKIQLSKLLVLQTIFKTTVKIRRNAITNYPKNKAKEAKRTDKFLCAVGGQSTRSSVFCNDELSLSD